MMTWYQFNTLAINPIISGNFDDASGDVPDEIIKIIHKLLEIEDMGTYSESSKDKIYEQILKASIDKFDESKRDEVIKWCKEYVADVWKR